VRCAAQSGVHTDSQELRAAPAAPPIKKLVGARRTPLSPTMQSIDQSIYGKQKDQPATFIAVKYTTCNDARPAMNAYKDILLRVT